MKNAKKKVNEKNRRLLPYIIEPTKEKRECDKKYKELLDFLKAKYESTEGHWVLENYEDPTAHDQTIINKILNDFLKNKKVNVKEQKFYRLIIRAIPLILAKNKCLSQNSLHKALNSQSSLLTRNVAPYLNPEKYKSRKNLGYMISEATRNKLCRIIYMKLKQNSDKITNDEILEYLREKLSFLNEIKKSSGNSGIHRRDISTLLNKDIFLKLEDYFKDLISIIREIWNNEKINNTIDSVNGLARYLIKNGYVSTFKFNGLNRAISIIIDDFNRNLPDFKLSRNKLYSEDKILGLNRTEIFKKYPNITRSELAQIKVFLKKIKLIEVLNKLYYGTEYKEEFKDICNECRISIKYLPCFQFHHSGLKSKSVFWDDIKYRPYNEIKKAMIKEKVIVLCSNCHEKRQAVFYNQFKDIIYKKNLFQLSGDEINILINQTLKEKGKKNKKMRLKGWIKQRMFIEQLYEGRCLGCGKICDKDSLPSFVFHHRSKKKINSWTNMKSVNFNRIFNWLKRDDCVCLCANCHSMLHSTLFLKYAEIILKDKNLKLGIKNEVYDLITKIKKYKFKDKIVINFLKRRYSYGKLWKEYLEHIYNISCNTNSDLVKFSALERSLRKRNVTREILDVLEEKKLIKIDIHKSFSRYPVIKLNKSGIKLAEESLQNRCIYRIYRFKYIYRRKPKVNDLKNTGDVVFNENLSFILEQLRKQGFIKWNEQHEIELTKEGEERYISSLDYI